MGSEQVHNIEGDVSVGEPNEQGMAARLGVGPAFAELTAEKARLIGEALLRRADATAGQAAGGAITTGSGMAVKR